MLTKISTECMNFMNTYAGTKMHCKPWEGTMLKGLVLPALNKSPNVKPDVVRTDEEREVESLKVTAKVAEKETGENRMPQCLLKKKGGEAHFYLAFAIASLLHKANVCLFYSHLFVFHWVINLPSSLCRLWFLRVASTRPFHKPNSSS